MKKNSIYTEYFVQTIKRKAIKTLAVYIAVAVLFAALCTAFCLLAAFDIFNLYVCCAINVLLSVAFLWYSYLFFAVVYKPVRAKTIFIKCLENVNPSVVEGTYSGFQKDEQYAKLFFGQDNVFKLDNCANNGFTIGKRYLLDVVNEVIIAYCEVENE